MNILNWCLSVFLLLKPFCQLFAWKSIKKPCHLRLREALHLEDKKSRGNLEIIKERKVTGKALLVEEEELILSPE